MLTEKYKQACADKWLGWKLTALESIDSDNEAIRQAAQMLIDECDKQMEKYK